jgi:UBX domain-containing protein 1
MYSTSNLTLSLRLLISTQYQNGFIVDDGPYRRLDDPANSDFLRALAMGRTPRELVEGSTDGSSRSTSSNNIVVGLIDKRSEEYVETFRSFSGSGATLGTTTTVSTDGVFDPATLPATTASESSSSSDQPTTTTSIAVRLPNGKRKIVTIALSATVTDLAIQLRDDADNTPFRIVTGFPPQTITNTLSTIEEAGLKGAQISMHKV